MPESPDVALVIELTLTDAAGAPIDTQTRSGGAPATPGGEVDFGTINISVTVSSVTVAPNAVSLSVSDQQRVTATVRNASGAAITTIPVAWTTSDATVAQLDATTGASVNVRALKLGTATIAANAGGRTSDSVTVTVTPPAPLTIQQRQGAGASSLGKRSISTWSRPRRLSRGRSRTRGSPPSVRQLES